MIDVRAHNRVAWNHQVERGNPWTLPASPEAIASAREGKWQIVLTPRKPVPADWFPHLPESDVLCLASGGGQQTPILVAAGATVTVIDNSPAQLARDQEVADREGLSIRSVEGDMRDLTPFDDESFDLIVHPVSNVFIPDVRIVWRECFRVLRTGGALLAGCMDPVRYVFDEPLIDEEGTLTVIHRLPYSDTESLSSEEISRRAEAGQALEFSHTLEDLIGGQTEAGFVITGFYGDRYGKEEGDVQSKYMDVSFATRAVKPE